MSIFQTETELWKLDDQETLEHTHGQKRKKQKNGGDDYLWEYLIFKL